MPKRVLFHLTAALLCAVFTSSIPAQGSGFAHKGLLSDGGSPVNGARYPVGSVLR